MTFDVDRYLDRLGRSGGRAHAPATPETLAALMRAHILAIPFENLDPVSGRAPSLELDELAGKLLGGGRGGYCYEHNTLFAAVLRELGFEVTLHAGRVMVGLRAGAGPRPRSHMLLFVHFDGESAPYLADVGFGTGGCLLEPIPLVVGAEVEDAPRRHRLVHAAEDGPLPQWVLQARGGTQGSDGARGENVHWVNVHWENQYTFTEERFQPPDYQMYNWYVATHPRSPFSHAPYIQRTFADRHLALDDMTLTETAADGTESVRELTDRAELIDVLRNDFGITAPDYLP